MREIVHAAMSGIPEVEMTEALGAERGERTEGRLGQRAGYSPRSLVTRVGELELRVPGGSEAPRDLGALPARRQATYPRLCDWVEDSVADTSTFNRLPREHREHTKSTMMLECFTEDAVRRTRGVRIFPCQESCTRLMRGLAVETRESRLEEHRYLDLALLLEEKPMPEEAA